jgi:DNA-binding SARP family transcriptional activator
MDALQLDLLGGFRARTAAGGVVALPTRKTQALLAFLATPTGQTHPRDKLAALLWSAARDRPARANLRQALARLRRGLGDPDALRLDGEEVGLDPARVVSDVQRFEACAAAGTPEALAEAAQLYRGDFLAGLSVEEPPFEEWLLAQREHLRERALEVLARLLALHRRAGQLEAAVQRALQLLALDPLQEPAHRALMRLYVQLGRRGAALRQYQICAAVLERELRAQPEPETKALYQQILTERPPASPRIADEVGAPGAERMPAPPPAESAGAPPTVAEGAPAPPPSKSLDLLTADLALVGRGAELARLTGLLDAAWSGQGQLAAILGDPGVGKSRLAAEVAIQASRRGAQVLVGRCFEIEQRLPFMAWVDALRDGGIPADGALMDSLGPVWRRQLARLLPELDEPVPPAEAGGDPLQLFEALARLLEALAQRAPLVILIEDGHWMDEMSRRLLPFLARRIRPWRLLWVSTFREEELAGDTKLRVIGDDLAREGLAVPLRLAPLSRAETLALVGQLVPPGTPASTGEEIWRTSEGNAFMAVETARALADPGPDSAGEARPVPRRVRDLVTGRLARLSPGAREVVALAATTGRQFEFDLIREASDVPEAEVVEAMEELVRRRIFRQSGEGFEFAHDRIREVAYASLLLPQRGILHRRVGEALERLHGAEAPGVAGALAFHFRQGGIWGKAVQHLGRFAEQAARGYAHGDAAEALQHALDALDRTPPSRERDRLHLELVLRRAQSQYFVGAWAESLEALRARSALLAEVDDPALSGPWHHWVAHIHGRTGNHEGACESARRAIEEAARAGDGATRGKAYGILSLESFWGGRPREGVALGERAVALLGATPEAWWEGTANFYILFNEVQLGRFAPAREAAARMHAIGERLADNRLCSYAAWMTGWIEAHEGQFAAAVASCERAIALATDPISAGYADAWLGYVQLEGGDADAAVPRLIQSIQNSRRLGFRTGEAWFAALLADARCLQRHDDAADVATSAWELAREVGFPFAEALARRAMGRVAWTRGARDDAERLLGAALDAFLDIEAEFEAARTRLDLAGVGAERGDRAGARVHLDTARSAFAQLDVGFYRGRADELAQRL